YRLPQYEVQMQLRSELHVREGVAVHYGAKALNASGVCTKRLAGACSQERDDCSLSMSNCASTWLLGLYSGTRPFSSRTSCLAFRRAQRSRISSICGSIPSAGTPLPTKILIFS